MPHIQPIDTTALGDRSYLVHDVIGGDRVRCLEREASARQPCSNTRNEARAIEEPGIRSRIDRAFAERGSKPASRLDL